MKPRARQLPNGWWACGQYSVRGIFMSVTRPTLAAAFMEWKIQVGLLQSLGMYWELFP